MSWVIKFETYRKLLEKCMSENELLEFGLMGEEKIPDNWQLSQRPIGYKNMARALKGKTELLKSYTTMMRMVDDFSFLKCDKMGGIKERKNQINEINALYHMRKDKKYICEISRASIKDIDQLELENIINNETINIDKIINRFYYKDDIQIEINKKLYEY